MESMERRHKLDNSKEEFYSLLNTLSPDAQELVTGLSSLLLEPDVYNIYVHDKKRLSAIKSALQNFGVKKNEIGKIMNFFNLPNQELEKKK